jgi:hypothetical protein
MGEIPSTASARRYNGGSPLQPRVGGAAALQRLSLLIVAMLLATPLVGAITLQIQQGSGGIVISGTHPNYSGTLGNVNGLGVGTPSAGVSLITAGVTGGVLYTTPYVLNISGMSGTGIATVTAYVSSNFARPAILILYSCPINTSCTTFNNFSVLSTSAAAPTTIIPSPGVGNNTSSTATLGLFVSNANGAAVTGAESATITFVATRTSNGNTDTVRLALNNETVQTAVQLLMAAAGGLPITAGSGTDYAMGFGNVNGLGIAPPTGLTVTSVSGGVVYATPYLLQPTFSSFTSTTGTLKTYVSTDFAHNSVLQLDAATAIGGPFTAISKSSATQTVLTSSATSGTNFTSYLGLFVSNVNGAGAFTGADNATLTYTLTVP